MAPNLSLFAVYHFKSYLKHCIRHGKKKYYVYISWNVIFFGDHQMFEVFRNKVYYDLLRELCTNMCIELLKENTNHFINLPKKKELVAGYRNIQLKWAK